MQLRYLHHNMFIKCSSQKFPPRIPPLPRTFHPRSSVPWQRRFLPNRRGSSRWEIGVRCNHDCVQHLKPISRSNYQLIIRRSQIKLVKPFFSTSYLLNNFLCFFFDSCVISAENFSVFKWLQSSSNPQSQNETFEVPPRFHSHRKFKRKFHWKFNKNTWKSSRELQFSTHNQRVSLLGTW